LTSSPSKVRLINSFNNNSKKSFEFERSNNFSDSDEALMLNDERRVKANRGAAAEQMISSLDLDKHISCSTLVLV
jgi:hypothetical protein